MSVYKGVSPSSQILTLTRLLDETEEQRDMLYSENEQLYEALTQVRRRCKEAIQLKCDGWWGFDPKVNHARVFLTPEEEIPIDAVPWWRVGGVNGGAPTPQTTPHTPFVEVVPDHCDRIVWRGNYYHLPIKPHNAVLPEGWSISLWDNGDPSKRGVALCKGNHARIFWKSEGESVVVEFLEALL